MKTVILAGGMGTRLSEETDTKPKPMVEIGGDPILWHILKHYSTYNHSEFVIALGHRGGQIKKYFAEMKLLAGDITVDFSSGEVHQHSSASDERWKVDLVDTGADTHTGGRILRLAPFLDGRFMVTYGDGVSDVNLDSLLAFHESHGKLATLTAVRPPARFGHLDFDGDKITNFSEKPQAGEGWINGGFLVLEPEVLDFIDGDSTDIAREPMERLAQAGQLMAYRHTGFWQCMDTLRDVEYLRNAWASGNAPWASWQQDPAQEPAQDPATEAAL